VAHEVYRGIGPENPVEVGEARVEDALGGGVGDLLKMDEDRNFELAADGEGATHVVAVGGLVSLHFANAGDSVGDCFGKEIFGVRPGDVGAGGPAGKAAGILGLELLN